MMSRTLSLLAATALIACTGVATAATNSKPNQPAAMGSDRFASEGDARAHCPSDTVVWVNTRSHVYHFAGTAQFGHTKHGAFMCQADANRVWTFRAAKGETARRTGSTTNMSGGSAQPAR